MNSGILKYVLLTFFVLFISCQKDKETISDPIVGKWDWEKSVSPWTGQVSNPQTVGYSIALEFTSDGIMKVYKNDTLLTTTNYRMEINASEPNSNYLIYGSGLRSLVYVSTDSLILNTAYVDGPFSKYIRLR
ncbi:MAG TPA: hypothetical protein VJ954_09835 [Ignavibacteriaceae bacterium]|nr:hypothetical protein [Ignavibacteriaceae bacterium]